MALEEGALQVHHGGEDLGHPVNVPLGDQGSRLRLGLDDARQGIA